MKKLICAFAVAAATFAAAVPAGAEPPQTTTFRTIGMITGPTTAQGTWVATGAVEDSGTYTETFEIVGSEITAQKILVGSRGTIVLEARSTVVFEGCEASFEGGRWRIVDGTGAYEKLRGGGKPLATLESRGNVCTGAVDVTHAGRAHVAGRGD
jgi:hypothetical protein